MVLMFSRVNLHRLPTEGSAHFRNSFIVEKRWNKENYILQDANDEKLIRETEFCGEISL